jgi:hypothetical protein
VPTIGALLVSSVRSEAGVPIQATAVVHPAGSPTDQLTYAWSAEPQHGMFTGTGAQVTWTSPVAKSPGVYTIALQVTETQATVKMRLQRSAASSASVHYNDSPLEVTQVGLRFLTNLFPTFSVSPQEAVQDFSDSTDRQPDGTVCAREKASELSDVTNNRINFHILGGSYTALSITFNPDRTFADVFGTCTFEDIPTNPTNPLNGVHERVTGICHLTSVYENWRWWLCASHFSGSNITPESVRYRVPGRIAANQQTPELPTAILFHLRPLEHSRVDQ